MRCPSSSVLTSGQPTVLTSTRLITTSRAWRRNMYTKYQSMIWTSCGSGLDMGWISEQGGVQCNWSVAKETGSMYPCRRWSLWILAVTLLAWHSSYHTTQPFSEPPVFRGKWYAFHHMNEFYISQGSVVTFVKCDRQVQSWLPFVMAALWNRRAIIFLPCGYYLFIYLSFYLFFSSPNLSGRRLDVYHTSTHGVALVRI